MQMYVCIYKYILLLASFFLFKASPDIQCNISIIIKLRETVDNIDFFQIKYFLPYSFIATKGLDITG